MGAQLMGNSEDLDRMHETCNVIDGSTRMTRLRES